MCISIVYMHVRYIVVFVTRCIIWKVTLICPYHNEYFDIASERGEIPKKLTMFNEFRLIVEFVGKSDCMHTDFCIFIDGLDIFRRYIQTFHLFALVIFDQRWDVAFTVVPSSSATYSSGTIIAFNTVKTNHGNAFNRGNYRFTAPSTGVYVFSWSIATHSSYIGNSRLMVNGSIFNKMIIM